MMGLQHYIVSKFPEILASFSFDILPGHSEVQMYMLFSQLQKIFAKLFGLPSASLRTYLVSEMQFF